jgi:hypothetical protein
MPLPHSAQRLVYIHLPAWQFEPSRDERLFCPIASALFLRALVVCFFAV